MLLKAWAVVEKKCEDWCLDIYGDGNRAYYQNLARKLQLDNNRCRLNGRISDVQKEYMNSSLFVCTSRFEGFGMGIIEAMACGLPVVAFDCLWGPRSIISNGEDGLLVENGNIEKFANTIVGLVNTPMKLQRMGENARKNVRRFNIDDIALEWKKLFDELLNEN